MLIENDCGCCPLIGAVLEEVLGCVTAKDPCRERQRLGEIDHETVKMMRKEVVDLIPRLIYADPRSKLESVKDAFDISVEGVIKKVMKLRRDLVEGKTDDDFIEELSWKYGLLDEGESVGVHEWDPFFSKSKPDNGNVVSDGSNSSLINEQKQQR